MRYLPLTDDDRRVMLERIGVSSIEDLFSDVPAAANEPRFDLPLHAGESEVERMLSRFALANTSAGECAFFCGAGAYRHYIPASVDYLVQRSEFLTSYTPYQPEISQGTLQTLFEFQTQVAAITGMEIANASMYDGSTGAAESVLMAHRITRRNRAVLSGNLHPHYAETIHTMAGLAGEIVTTDPSPGAGYDVQHLIDDQTSCLVIQNPDIFGSIRDLAPLAEAAHSKGALLVVVFTEVVSLGLIRSPGAMGADIVVGEGQSLGNALNFGGPFVGLFSSHERFVRQMPGRLAGQTVDTEGRRGFVLTLSAREQHIRREKATSNICTNSGLCALAFSIHLSLLGETGFRKMARLNHSRAVALAERLANVPGVELATPAFFNEFTLRLRKPSAEVVDALIDRHVLGGVPGSRLFPGSSACEDLLIVAATETNTEADIALYHDALESVLAS
jgi:glycine dehydrogenase subunit 1